MTLPANIEAKVLTLLDRFGCALVLGTLRREKTGKVLRLLIERKNADPDKGSGVTVELCASVSRDLGSLLDVEDLISGSYTLEVSSPGIERPLVRPGDFERFVGRKAAISTRRALEGRRRFKGVLDGTRGGTVLLIVEDGHTVAIPDEIIEKANLVFEF